MTAHQNSPLSYFLILALALRSIIPAGMMHNDLATGVPFVFCHGQIKHELSALVYSQKHTENTLDTKYYGTSDCQFSILTMPFSTHQIDLLLSLQTLAVHQLFLRDYLIITEDRMFARPPVRAPPRLYHT